MRLLRRLGRLMLAVFGSRRFNLVDMLGITVLTLLASAHQWLFYIPVLVIALALSKWVEKASR